jgi:hypothetical protein
MRESVGKGTKTNGTVGEGVRGPLPAKKATKKGGQKKSEQGSSLPLSPPVEKKPRQRVGASPAPKTPAAPPKPLSKEKVKPSSKKEARPSPAPITQSSAKGTPSTPRRTPLPPVDAPVSLPPKKRKSQAVPKPQEASAPPRPPARTRVARATRKERDILSAPVPAQLPSVTVEPPHRHPTAAALKSFEQGVKVFNRRHYREAQTIFENLTAKFPQELEILARVQTYLHVCAQRLSQAKVVPESATTLYDEGVYALNKGDLLTARTRFNRALQLTPHDPHLLYSMAVTLLQSGQIDECLEYLERSLTLQPRLRSLALQDSDFTELRENRQFLALMGMASPFDRLDSRK